MWVLRRDINNLITGKDGVARAEGKDARGRIPVGESHSVIPAHS